MIDRRAIALACLVASLPWCTASGQVVRANGQKQPPVSSRGRLPVTGCAGQPISDIIVITQPPFTDRLPTRLEWVRRTVRKTHANTRDDVVRRFLLMKVGDPCNQIRRAESERILRAQPFLVDARIRAYDDEAGGPETSGCRCVDSRSGWSERAMVDRYTKRTDETDFPDGFHCCGALRTSTRTAQTVILTLPR